MKIPLLLFRTFRNVNSSRVNWRSLHGSVLTGSVPAFNENSIKTQLDELSIPYKDGYTCLHLKECLCCDHLKNVSNSADIFVNKRTGFFLCEYCKATGDWASYSSLLSKVKDENVDVGFYKKQWEKYDNFDACWGEVAASTEPLKNFSDTKHMDLLKEFKLPLCSRTVSDVLNVRVNRERNLLFFPLHCSGSPTVGYKTYDIRGKENTFPRVNCPGFLSYSSSEKSVAVVVANICDFLALISQNLYGCDIICLQYGATYIPQSTLPFFEKYKKIILWLGEGSLDTTGNVAKKLVEKRCFVVRPTENQVSASLALSKKQNIGDILTNAKLTWHQYVTTFSALREEILAEIQNNYESAGVQWKRFPALTKILKGHRRGELTILTGPTGVGKTTFLSEYSLDLAMQGVNTLWGSFEIKNTRLAKVMLTQFSGGPLSENVTEYNALCDRFEELPIFFLSFHGQQELSVVMDAVKHCSYIYDIAHVIIDNVQFMIDVSPDASQLDRFWKQDVLIQSFRSFASNFNCHVTLVMHPRKIEGVDLNVNSIFGGVKASQEADNILIIQRKELNTFCVKKFLQVSKNRYSGDLGAFRLYFDKPSLSFSNPLNFSNSLEEQDSADLSENQTECEDEYLESES